MNDDLISLIVMMVFLTIAGLATFVALHYSCPVVKATKLLKEVNRYNEKIEDKP